MILLKNKKATLNYTILDKYNAGIVLFGHEVKSLRKSQGSFNGVFISLKPGLKNYLKPEVYLNNFFIPPFQEKNTKDSYDPNRLRKLLLTRKEIRELEKKLKVPGRTLIPLSIFTENNFIKINFALATGKNKHDKREDLKKKAQNRDLQRELKQKIRIK